MISMELSGVQRNEAVSAEHASAVAQFLAQGGKIQVVEGFVHTHRPETKPYGRNHAQPVESEPESPKPKRLTGAPGVRVSQATKVKVKQLAVSMTAAQAKVETGLSLYVLKRIAQEGGFEFSKYDPNGNLVTRQIDPVIDALNVVRIKEARDRGLSQKAAIRELSISNTMMKRLIRDYAIDYPLKRAKR